METFKELGQVISAWIVLSFVGSVVEFQSLTFFGFFIMLIVFGLILFVYLLAKKLTGYYFSVDEESRIWSLKRYGFRAHQYFNNEVPLGIILPIVVLVLSLGTIPWYASLQSDLKPRKYKQVRKDGLLSFTNISDRDSAFVSAAGVFSCLLIAFFAYILNLPLVSRIAIQFSFFNMIPFGQLDGTKLFFGNRSLWMVLSGVVLVALAYSFFLV
ncbi:MAG: hypothetical protein AABW73_04015 [Nanoarchaeota archaeon]